MTFDFEGVHPHAVSVIRPFFECVLKEAGNVVHSMYVVGTAVTEDYKPKASDVNSLLVFKEFHIEVLTRLAKVGKKFAKKRIALPFNLTEEDVRSSIDVFPVEFLNLTLLSRCVLGHNLLHGLKIEKRDLRLQCERELKSKLIWLSRMLLASQGNASLLRSSLVRCLKDLVPLFRAIIFLFGQAPPRKKDEVMNALSGLVDLPMGAFRGILSLEEAGARRTWDELLLLTEDLYRLTRRLSDIVDGLGI